VGIGNKQVSLDRGSCFYQRLSQHLQCQTHYINQRLRAWAFRGAQERKLENGLKYLCYNI
jgi:hypothetical protein